MRLIKPDAFLVKEKEIEKNMLFVNCFFDGV